MPDTFNPVVPPSRGQSKADHFSRVIATTFGDGYIQHSLDGTGNKIRVLTLFWDFIEHDDMRSILNFIRGAQGIRPFFYTPFGETNEELFLPDWTLQQAVTVTPLSTLSYSMQITLRQASDLLVIPDVALWDGFLWDSGARWA